MEHKNYQDIQVFQPKFLDGFKPDDLIFVEEKIDGANASFQYNHETGKIEAFSRKTKLSEENNLRGFYQWTQSLDTELFEFVAPFRFFGEWLVPHTVQYPQDKYQRFYLFDIYDTVSNKWFKQSSVRIDAKMLNLEMVPIFYEGEFKTLDNCLQFLGKTKMGGEYGEGIVIKNMTALAEERRTPSYCKIVCEQFAERHTCHVKIIDPDKIKAKEQERELVGSVVTRARVEKLINKFVDEGILPEDWDNASMGTIAKNLGRALYTDCVKETFDVVEQCENFGKVANSLGMEIVKQILKERINVN